ncbi:hypothetical protein ACP4OV_001542 [Aristida adscensionis]
MPPRLPTEAPPWHRASSPCPLHQGTIAATRPPSKSTPKTTPARAPAKSPLPSSPSCPLHLDCAATTSVRKLERYVLSSD